jgi:two-component system sensor histidine kinase VicK
MENPKKNRELHTVAHDLRNPLGGIFSLTGILIDEGGLSSDQLQMLNLIRETAEHTLQVVEGLLNKDGPTLGLNKKSVNINDVLKRTVKMLGHRAKEKIHLLVCEEECIVEINEGDVVRVLDNLIYNAIKFTPNGGSIYVTLRADADSHQIVIRDTGIGIPENMRAKLFEGYSETMRSGTAGERSLGLGLRICTQIINAHKGKLWLECQPGPGATFVFSLPKKPETFYMGSL